MGRESMAGPQETVPWWRRADWGALLVVLVVLASSAASLANGFAYDDVPIVEQNSQVTNLRWPWAYFRETYWSPPWGVALYRPLTILLFSVQWRVADWAAVTFHAVNITAYAAVALLVLRLARTLVRPVVALGVAVLWAAHPVHTEVVANVVGQSELWVALASLVAIDCWRRVAASGVLTPHRFAAILLCSAIALGAKESGVVLSALLMVLCWEHSGRAVPWGSGHPTAGLLLRAVGYVLVLYLGARYAILGTLGGDVAHSAVAHLTTGRRVSVALGLLVQDARLLMWPGPLRADYSPPAFAIHPTIGLVHIVTLTLGAAVLLAVRWLRRQRRELWPWLWGGLALLPTSNLLFPTGVVLAERSLFVPSIAVAIGVGQLVELVLEQYGARIGRGVRALVIGAVAGVTLQWSRASAERQPVWSDTPTLIASSAVDDPLNPRWQRVLGIQFLRMREYDRAEAHLRAAATLASGDFNVVFGLVRVLERQGRCAEALTWYARLLDEFPPTTRAHLGEIACQIRERRYRDARGSALRARAGGLEPEPFSILIALADSLLRATDSLGSSGVGERRVQVGGIGSPVIIEVDDSGRLTRRDLAADRVVRSAGRPVR